ncbi:MAG: class I SAM-dependent methyltransferase [Ectothiorhodospiraceae bacterium AqS1]|nr:class I SAM-dependent methyltransferase [Ectothiorhodospiraceae bacterium AqS1]
MSDKTTHFGFEEIPVGEKARRVDAVFDSVAQRYDLMNDLMSLGLHRVWKHFAVHLARVRKGMRVLDLAAGTGDLSLRLAPMVGRCGQVVLADSNRPMLVKGRDRLLDRGHVGTIEAVRCDAQGLPFPDRVFDRVLIGFGLRNITHKELALAEMRRVLRPSGMALVLEFSRFTLPALAPIYDLWSFRALPRIGEAVVGDADSYRYLAESIRRHPDQESLLAAMGDAGFERRSYHNLCGGVVAVHKGFRL